MLKIKNIIKHLELTVLLCQLVFLNGNFILFREMHVTVQQASPVFSSHHLFYQVIYRKDTVSKAAIKAKGQVVPIHRQIVSENRLKAMSSVNETLA